MKSLLYTMLAIVFLTSTAGKITSSDKGLEKQLLGKWQYTGQTGGFAGSTEPQKSNSVKVIEFKKDGKYVRYKNGEPMYQGNYELCKAKSIHTGKIDNAIWFDPRVDANETGNILTIEGDTLILADNINDGYTIGYKRLSPL
jgi:hypothetical protein